MIVIERGGAVRPSLFVHAVILHPARRSGSSRAGNDVFFQSVERGFRLLVDRFDLLVKRYDLIDRVDPFLRGLQHGIEIERPSDVPRHPGVKGIETVGNVPVIRILGIIEHVRHKRSPTYSYAFLTKRRFQDFKKLSSRYRTNVL